MTSDVVARFLAQQPTELTRVALAKRFPEALAPQTEGAAWAALADELGIPCPPALVLLGDAMLERQIYFSFERHSYEMLTPPEAKDELAFMATHAAGFPLLQRAMTMLPVFGQDGDLLLLDREGAMHAYAHDDWQEMPRVADSLEDLLARTTKAALNL